MYDIVVKIESETSEKIRELIIMTIAKPHRIVWYARRGSAVEIPIEFGRWLGVDCRAPARVMLVVIPDFHLADIAEPSRLDDFDSFLVMRPATLL